MKIGIIFSIFFCSSIFAANRNVDDKLVKMYLDSCMGEIKKPVKEESDQMYNYKIKLNDCYLKIKEATRIGD